MDLTPAVALATEHVTTSSPPSPAAPKENGAAAAALPEDPASSDEGFETASDPDTDDPPASPEHALPPTKSAPATAAVVPNGGLEEKLEMGDGERETPEGLVPAGSDDAVDGPAGTEVAGGVADGEGEKEGRLGDGQVDAEVSAVADGAATAAVMEKSETVEADDVGYAEGVGKNGAVGGDGVGDAVGVEKNGMVESDAVVAAEEVEKSGVMESDAVVAAEDVEKSGAVEADAVGAAEDVEKSGAVESDAVGAAEDVEKSGAVEADAVGAAEDVEKSGAVESDAVGAAEVVEKNGAVESDAVVAAEGVEKIGAVESDAVVAVDEVEKNGMVGSDVVAPADEIEKSGEVEAAVAVAAAVVEENGVPNASVENNENFIGAVEVSEPVEEVQEAAATVGPEEAASSFAAGGAPDLNSLEEKPVTGQVRKDEAADTAGSNQELELSTELKAIDVEVENHGSADIAEDKAKLQPIEAESVAADTEKSGVDDGAFSKPSIEEDGGSVTVDSQNAADSADKVYVGNESEAVVAIEVAGRSEISNGTYEPAHSEIAKDSEEKLDVMNDGEAVDGVTSTKPETGDVKAEPESGEVISVQEAEPSHITAEESHAREVKPVDSSAIIAEESQSSDVELVKSSPVTAEVSQSREVEPVDSSPNPAVESQSREAEPVNLSPITAEESPKKEVEAVESSPIISEESQSREVEPASVFEGEVKADGVEADAVAAFTASAAADDDEKMGINEAEEEDEGSVSEGPARVAILESSETAKQIIKEMEEGSSSSSYHSGFRSSGENSRQLDGQIVTDSEEEGDTDEEGEGRELFDSAALTALLKAATSASSDGGITITSQDASRIFSVNRPAGLGSSVPSLKPASSRSSRPSPFNPSDMVVLGEPENNIDEEEKKLQEKVEQIRVKFLRLVQRLGHSPEDTVAAQVLYRLGLAEGIRHGRQISRLFSVENAKKKALQLEEEGKEDLDFSCNILVLGKTGVGKSATINSIFGEGKSLTNPFEPATTSVREISGIVDGVKIRVLDTPGLRASMMDQTANRKILLAIKKHTKRCPPDIVLYVDRMDTQTRDFNDLPLLRSITSTLGSSIWFNAIVALTHAASAPPDGPNGSPLSYEVFIAQRSHVVQHSIRQAAGDMRLMNPVALVENHPSCRRNREGERVLPNGLSWRPQLLLLCYSSKILSEANALLKLQDPSPGKLFGFRARSPPLPYLLSSLLQSRPHPKLSADQGGDNGDSDIDLDDLSDTEQEEEDDEYDQLPPFKPLRKSQIAKLTKEQKKAYFDEYDYRFKLLQKKQWKEELKRMKEMKKKGKSQQDDLAYGDMAEDFDQDGTPAAVPVPLPDMVLPPSFDCDNPVHRYRFLEPTSQLLIRPVLDSHGWDHDCGYDGVSIEESLAIASRFPAGIAVQITKDKKEFNVHLDSSISAKHGENGSTLAGFDIQSIGKQLAYVLRGETKFKNLKKNKTAAGISVTFLGETVATGLKIEDQLSIGKRVGLVASTGAVRAQGDMAYGANLEARLKDKDYPIGQALTTLGLSLMKWRSDLALGANLQSQFSIGRSSKVAIRVGLNNKLTGQITVRTSSSEQLQIALLGIIPLAANFYRSIVSGESYMGN